LSCYLWAILFVREFIDSLVRPGGNITGVTGVVPTLNGKLLEVLIDAVPGVTRVGVLRDPVRERLSLTEMENAARALRVRLKISKCEVAMSLRKRL
jgi:putative tryptophan/tyrosine transport system substrate-binding protein